MSVTVTSSSASTASSRTMPRSTTDSTGTFRAPLLSLGNYKVTLELTGFSKLERTAITLGAEPARTTVVEDTPTGIAAAKAAGMRAIGFCAMTPAVRLHAAGADAVVGTLEEVRALLTRPLGPLRG